MSRNILSAEERIAYDELMFEAGCYADGKPRPSHEIAERVIRMLREAGDQAHQKWAELIIEEILTVGARTQWRAWNRERVVVTVGDKTYVTTKPAAMGIRKQDPETQRTYYQLTFWQDMTADELVQIIDGSSKRIASERASIAAAKRLLALIEQVPGARTARDAALATGVDIAEYLAGDIANGGEPDAGEEAA